MGASGDQEERLQAAPGQERQERPPRSLSTACPVPRSVETCHTNQNPKFPVQRANMIFLLSEARGIGINDSDILLYFYTAFHCPCFERFRSNVSFNLLQPDSPGRRDCRNMTPFSMLLLSPILSVQLSHTYLLYQACCSVHDK